MCETVADTLLLLCDLAYNVHCLCLKPYFNSLTLVVGWQDGHLVCKKFCASNTQPFFFQETFRGPGIIWSDLRINRLLKQKLISL